MLATFENRFAQVRAFFALAAIATIALALGVDAKAATTADFDLTISRLQSELPSSTGGISTPSVKGAIIDLQNNRPWLELKNTSTDMITEFSMTIPEIENGTRPFHFAMLPQGLINVGSNPSNETVNATAPNGGDLLLLSFPGGLDPNQYLQFQIRFASDSHPDTGLPSFGLVLFNMCCDGEPMGDSTVVSIDFTDAAGAVDTFTSEWNPEDPTYPYCIGDYAPPGSSIIVNPPVDITFPETPVPEPGSIALTFLALCGLGTSLRARRNRHSA